MTALLVIVGALLLLALVEPRVARVFEILAAWVIAIPILLGLSVWELLHGRRPL